MYIGVAFKGTSSGESSRVNLLNVTRCNSMNINTSYAWDFSMGWDKILYIVVSDVSIGVQLLRNSKIEVLTVPSLFLFSCSY